MTFLLLRVIKSKKLLKHQYRFSNYSTSSNCEDEKERELARLAKDASIDEPPTSCCQAGCANCVFIVWAEALTTKMQNASPEIANKILSTVEDPNMKAYLEMELRLRGLNK